VEGCKRSSRVLIDQFWFGGPMTVGAYRDVSSELSRGSTCRRIRYRRFSQPGGLWANRRDWLVPAEKWALLSKKYGISLKR
jgi:hypothetical protein